MSDEVVLRPSLRSAVAIKFLKGLFTNNRDLNSDETYLPHFLLSIVVTGGIVGLLYLLSRVFAPNLAITMLFTAIFVWPPVQMYFLVKEMKNRKYIIRDDGVEIVDDYLDRSNTAVSFENVTDVKLSQPFLQRSFGTGNVEVETAGSDDAEIQFNYLKDAESVQEELSEMVRNTEYKQGYENQTQEGYSDQNQNNDNYGKDQRDNNEFNQGGRR